MVACGQAGLPVGSDAWSVDPFATEPGLLQGAHRVAEGGYVELEQC